MDATLAYDSVRGVCVLFGGHDGTLTAGDFDDTWEFDGLRWRLRATGVPGPAFPRGSAFDPTSAVVRVYIGANGQSSGTWEWDGSSWTHASTQYLRIARWSALAYDERRGVIVLHGGWPTYPNPSWSETWEWNGFGWTFVSERGPVAQFNGASMVYDSRRGVCVVFSDEGASGNTWEWDGLDWRIAATSGPPGRYTCGLAYDSQRSVVVMFGGADHAVLGDTWEYDGDVWRRRIVTGGPAPRSRHNMAYDSQRAVTVLFGGGGASLFNDTWQWDGTKWTLFQPCEADCDTSTGQRVLDIFDFLCFQNRYATGTPYACDCDTSSGPGLCDIFDFLCFQNAYAAGCR